MELKIFRDALPAAGTNCTLKAELPLETEILISDYLPPVFKLVKCFVAVQIFGLAFHLHGPCREDELRQIQQLGKRELLLGLAQTRPLFPLIIDHTAQVALQLQLAGLQPPLQHHRPRQRQLDQRL